MEQSMCGVTSLERDEAVDLLNTVLHEKGIAAVRNVVRTIVTREKPNCAISA
jgi:hypothetical protein